MSYGVGLRNGVAFALGTIPSLTSGGGLRPSLLLDFLSGSLDPRITFSRGTQAMQYGSDGTLQYAPNNLLTYSNQADNAAWTKSNSFVQTNLLLYSQDFDNVAWGKSLITVTANVATAPDGTLTADRIISAGGAYPQTSQNPTLAAGDYTFSLWVKSDGTPQIAQSLLLDGTPVNFTPTDTWTRVSVTKTGVLAGPRGIVLATNSPTAPASSFYVWGAQLVQGSVPGDYRATTSAALPVLYADYNGNLRARKLCEDAANTSHRANQTVTMPLGAETTSIYVKAGERTKFQIDCSDNLTGNAAYLYDLSAGTTSLVLATGSWTGISPTITPLSNGWYRCILTAVRGAGTGVVFNITLANAAGAGSYTGDGSSGIYIADAQLTPGYLPLAVTETTSAAVYGPRLDYDPGTLVTQNLLTYSGTVGGTNWAASGFSSITLNAAAAPDGTQTATRFTAASQYAGVTQTYAGFKKSTTYTLSGWVRLVSGTLGAFALQGYDGITFQNTNITATAAWQRFSFTFTTGATATQLLLSFQDNSASNWATYDIVWAQLNQGSTALPYTATTTAQYTLTTALGYLEEEQRTNLATFSNTFSDASWTALGTKNVAASAILSPEGVANAWTLTDSSAVAFDGIQKSVTVAADGTTYTGSIYILKTTGGTSSTFGINLAITGGTTVTNQPRINTDTGAVLSGTATVTNAGLWWRVACSVTNNSSVGNTTLTMAIYPATAAYNSGTDSAAATGSATIYGAQIEAGAKATTYIPTVASTATRNADLLTLPAGSWYNTAAGTWYFNGETQPFPRYLIVDNSGAAKYPMYVHSAAGGIGNFDGTNLTLTANNTTAGTTFKAATSYSGTTATAVLNAGTVATGTYNGAFSTITTFRLGSATGPGGEINGHIRSIRYYPTALPNASLQSITA